MQSIIYFVRHGETDWNAERRFQGQADTDVNARGLAQVERNGRRLAELLDDPAAHAYVASPMRRTRETMRRIRAVLGLAAEDFEVDPRLLEMHFGDWQGRTVAEIAKDAPESVEARHRDKWGFRPPGGESENYDLVSARVKPWLDAVTRPTVCVTHGGVIRSALYLTGNMGPQEAALLDVPQDRVLILAPSRCEWA